MPVLARVLAPRGYTKQVPANAIKSRRPETETDLALKKRMISHVFVSVGMWPAAR